jgi:hypothetical protein
LKRQPGNAPGHETSPTRPESRAVCELLGGGPRRPSKVRGKGNLRDSGSADHHTGTLKLKRVAKT